MFSIRPNQAETTADSTCDVPRNVARVGTRTEALVASRRYDRNRGDDVQGYEVNIIHTIADEHDDNVDVEVRFDDGRRLAATFSPSKTWSRFSTRFARPGSVVLGCSCGRSTSLIREGEFETAFARLSDD